MYFLPLFFIVDLQSLIKSFDKRDTTIHCREKPKHFLICYLKKLKINSLLHSIKIHW